MKVLILCDMFPPAFGPRMGYLCKYLGRAGWEPTVIAEHISDATFAFLKGNTPVTYVHFYKAKGTIARRIEWLGVFLLNVLSGYKDRKIYREALKQAKQQAFDLILCSTYRTFPLSAAQKVARKTKLPLVVDLRDIIEQYTGAEFMAHALPKCLGLEKVLAAVFKKYNLKQRNRVLRQADYVTTVSPWHVDILKSYNPHVALIYNGYDPEVFCPKPVRSDRFYITYTGRLLSLAMRNPDLLFRAVKRLMDERIITPDTFNIRWYTDEASQIMLENEAKKYLITAYMSYHGYVPATEISYILNESSILLQLTNKADASGPQGIMTTKFFEALAVEKPVLCVRGDEGCLEEVINRTQAGLSAHNEQEVYEFIKVHYLHWKATGQVVSTVKHEEVIRFSREEQATQFIRIFEQILKSDE